MTSSTDPSRRQVLCGIAVALLAPGALATACGGSGSTGSGSPGAGSQGTGSPGSGGGATTGGGTTGGGTAGGGSATGTIAKVSDVPVGGGILVNGPNGMVLLVQPTAGTIKGFDPTCPHLGFSVDTPRGGVITCPSHGSQFSAADGSVRVGPATSPLRAVNVTVSGPDVVLA